MASQSPGEIPKTERPIAPRKFWNNDRAKGTMGEPAIVAHSDYTVRSAVSLFDSMAKAEYRKGRYAVINVWRSVSENHPIQNDHLAMCDARTIIAPDDFVNCDVIYPDHVSETYRLDPGHNCFHEWYYFPNMVKNEVLIFMQYDSNSRSKTRYTFHTSMQNPNAPKDAAPRQSIECRCLAFFPHHEPNTIPSIIYKDGEIISVAIFNILHSLPFASYWPKDVQKRMSKELYLPGGVRRVIEELVHGGAKRMEHGLDKASKEERNLIVEKLMSDGNFEEAAKRHLPILMEELSL